MCCKCEASFWWFYSQLNELHGCLPGTVKKIIPSFQLCFSCPICPGSSSDGRDRDAGWCTGCSHQQHDSSKHPNGPDVSPGGHPEVHNNPGYCLPSLPGWWSSSASGESCTLTLNETKYTICKVFLLEYNAFASTETIPVYSFEISNYAHASLQVVLYVTVSITCMFSERNILGMHHDLSGVFSVAWSSRYELVAWTMRNKKVVFLCSKVKYPVVKPDHILFVLVYQAVTSTSSRLATVSANATQRYQQAMTASAQATAASTAADQLRTALDAPPTAADVTST